jgi:hypothetical protein
VAERAVAILMLVACRSASDPPRPPPPAPKPVATAIADAGVAPPDAAPPEVRKLWTPRIDDMATFDAYSKEIGGERFGKLVIDVKTDAVYYFDVDVYKVHKDFIFQELYKKPRTKEANRAFDKNYGETKTDFMMVYLVHHIALDVWTFAFWDGDLATAAHVRRAYKRLRETFFLGDKVKFRPDSPHQEAVARTLKDVPVVFNDQLYEAAPYHAFNKGVAVGVLRHVPPNVPESELTFDPNEIVVLHAPLADITPVAGIISETFSTPLSHVSLRARGWNIPNIGLKNADDKIAGLAGKTVYFEARDVDYVLREATPAEIAARDAKAKPKPIELPIADLDATDLAPLTNMRAADVVKFGAKAANLGEIVHAKLPGFQVPMGFGVPFHYYAEAMAKSGLDKQVVAMLADPAFRDPSVRRQKLAALRDAIVKAPPPDDLVTAVDAALADLTHGDDTIGVFCRSSTNAEDLDGYSGAGDYDTVPNMKGTAAVVHAIQQVWASVWNVSAFEDRSHAGIDHAKVYGAVLVQIGVDATAAGVLVTQHPTDPSDERNYTINAKSGLGMSVVDGKAVPESLIVSWYNHGIRVLSRSTEDTKLVFDEQGGVREVPNPDKGKAVLSTGKAIALVDAAHQLTRVFKSTKLDVEWVFAGDQLYIVQTRPLIVR